jgi:hypothetical protein
MIYDHIKNVPSPYKTVCDDAFYTQGDLEGKLVKTKEKYLGEGHTRDGYDQSLTHLRQCSEWGNEILFGCWRRLKTKLPTNNTARARLQWCCILLHNFRTEKVGRNQIRTYFEEVIQHTIPEDANGNASDDNTDSTNSG